jgi:hypothetical protein
MNFHVQGFEDKAGCWMIGGKPGLQIWINNRPRWLTRLMVRWLFEWDWIDREVK